jgi:hypothetical protein
MKVPTSGTSVYQGVARTGTGSTAQVTASFAPDASIIKERNTAGTDWGWYDKLRGNTQVLRSALTNAEITNSTTQEVTAFTNTGFSLGSTANYISTNTSGYSYINYALRRAPSFFDVVCYTGDGTNGNINHNLGVAPELIITKRRNAIRSWYVDRPNGNGYTGVLNSANAWFSNWSAGSPTATASVFQKTEDTNGATYVAYLFATCAGVSKCFNYTGNGSSQTINCGFTGGARWVMIKRTDSTGDWYVWDSARGIVSGNDPHLSLNTTAAEVTSDDTIDTDSTGFVVNQVSATNVNVSSATYLGIAIA